MGMVDRKDLILRLIEQFGLVLTSLLGLRKAGRREEALAKLAFAGDDILGVPRRVLDSLDSASAVRMLAEPYKVRMYARLLREEAELLAELGRESSLPRRRSAELVIEATRLKGGVKQEDRTELLALGEVQLSERYAAEARTICGVTA